MSEKINSQNESKSLCELLHNDNAASQKLRQICHLVMFLLEQNPQKYLSSDIIITVEKYKTL